MTVVWVLTDNRPGTATQALAVAEHLGRPFVEKRLTYDGLARLPNILRGASLVGVDDATRASLAAPWPDVVIGAGRRAAGFRAGGLLTRWRLPRSGLPRRSSARVQHSSCRYTLPVPEQD